MAQATGSSPSRQSTGSTRTSDGGRRDQTVTRLLERLSDGDSSALDALLQLLYDELRMVAHRQRQRWRGHHTLHTTALVHEAYLKLVDQEHVNVESRAHFFALASRAMRHLLCNYARDQKRQKRGGGIQKLPLDEALGVPAFGPDLSEEEADRLEALDNALRRLERLDPQLCQIVECRFFGGMTIADTAAALAISPATVKRHWTLAQAWLHLELEGTR